MSDQQAERAAYADDLAPLRHSVRLRDRCREAVLAKAAELGWPLSFAQANVAYDTIREVLAEQERPHVRVDPAINFGRPHIRGISTEAIVGPYVAGEAPEAVCDDYGLTRRELVLACWHEAMHGERPEWREWAQRIHPALAGWRGTTLDVDDLPATRSGDSPPA